MYPIKNSPRTVRLVLIVLVLLSAFIFYQFYQSRNLIFELSREITKLGQRIGDNREIIIDLHNQIRQKAVKLEINPIMSGSKDSSWENDKLVAGNCLVKTPQGETALFYYSNGQNGNSVGLALSKDNQNFEKNIEPVLEPGASHEWDGGGVFVFPGGIIKRRDGTFQMYYSGIRKDSPDFYWNQAGAVGVAFSEDLIHWEKYKRNPVLKADPRISWEAEGIFEPSVIFTGDEYGGPAAFKMWYGGNNKDGIMRIGYAESSDGVTWEKHEANPVLGPSEIATDFDGYTIEVHDVIIKDGRYLMAYEATDRKFPSKFSIGLADSEDGISWTKSTKNPILEAGPEGSWDSMGAYHPAFLIDNKRVLMYYVGLNNKYDHQIGLSEINHIYLDF